MLAADVRHSSAGSGGDIAGDDIANVILGFANREYWHGILALAGLTLLRNLLAYWMLRRGRPTFLELKSRDVKLKEALLTADAHTSNKQQADPTSDSIP